MSGKSVGGAAAVEHFIRPRSIAIVGLSSKPGSAGMNLLANLTLNAFAGDIHLVGRSGGAVDGRNVQTDIAQLPEGIDLAIFALPETGVKAALEACVRRKVKAVAVLASGFAEVGDRSSQDEIARIARDGGIALLGPNCFGYTNFVDGFHAAFVAVAKVPRLNPGRVPARQIVGVRPRLDGTLTLTAAGGGCHGCAVPGQISCPSLSLFPFGIKGKELAATPLLAQSGDVLVEAREVLLPKDML